MYFNIELQKYVVLLTNFDIFTTKILSSNQFWHAIIPHPYTVYDYKTELFCTRWYHISQFHGVQFWTAFWDILLPFQIYVYYLIYLYLKSTSVRCVHYLKIQLFIWIQLYIGNIYSSVQLSTWIKDCSHVPIQHFSILLLERTDLTAVLSAFWSIFPFEL